MPTSIYPYKTNPENTCFHVQGQTYQFKALPFGLSTAPMEFTLVAKEVIALQKGIRIHQYLDNWLVRARSCQTCLQQTQTLVAICRELGWLVNMEKSKLDPKQVFDFVGYQFNDLREGKVISTVECWQTLTAKIQDFLAGPTCPADVPHRAANSHRKTNPSGPVTHEAHTVALEKQNRITRKGDPHPQAAPPSSKMEAGGKQCTSRSTIKPAVVAYINKWWGMKSGPLCALLWRILAWLSRKQVTVKA